MANWDKISSEGDVEDRRSVTGMAVGGLSLTTVVVVFLFNYLAGGTPMDALNQLQNIPVEQQQNVTSNEITDNGSYKEFASKVLGSSNDMWTEVFNKQNKTFTPPKLVLFRQATQSGCGGASSAEGPHYCPVDDTIYLDETFFDELTNRFGAKGGDVAQAYVMAHEAGHHAQNEMGIMDKVEAAREKDPEEANAMSVKLELQADCFAGLWAHSIKDAGVFQQNEIGEAIDAAAAVGDDRIQAKVTGRVNPETWTHGSSAQRVSWFNKGYETGTLASCDTFN